jgi:hypothetical protein
MSDISQNKIAPMTPAPIPQVPSPATPSTSAANTPNYFQAPKANIEGVGKTLAPLAAGAVNGALFGIPEAIANKVGGRQWLQNIKNENPTAYNVGNIAGGIGSTFIPVVGLAGKLLEGISGGTKLLAGAGRALQMIGSATKGAGLIGRGISEGAAQQGLRSAASGDENAVQDIATAGLLGGVGGAVGSAIGSAIKRGPKMLEEIADTADRSALKDLIPGFNKKSLMKAVAGNPLTAGKFGYETIENSVKETAALVRDLSKEGSINTVTLKGLIEDNAAQWKPINDTFQKVLDANPGYMTANADTFKALPEVKDFLKFADSKGMTVKANAMLNQSFADADNAGSLFGIKQSLDQDTMLAKKAYFNGGTLNGDKIDQKLAAKLGDATYAIRQDIANKAIDMAGADPNIGKIWKASLPLKYAIVNDAARGGTTTGANSATFMRQAMNAVLTGGGAAVGGPVGAIAANALGGVVNSATSKLANKAIGTAALGVRPAAEALMPAAEKLASSGLGGIVEKATPEAARLAAYSVRKNIQDNDPAGLSDQSIKAIQGDSKNTNTFNDAIVQGINNQWYMQTAGLMGKPDTTNKQYTQFAQGVMYALTNQGKTGIDPHKAASILFLDPSDQQQYVKAIDALTKAQGNLPEASGAMGLINRLTAGMLNTKASSARGALEKAVEEITGGGAQAKAVMNQLDRTPPAQRNQVLLEALKAGNPEGFKRLQLAGQAQ